MKKSLTSRGHTLLEAIVVIGIVGIVASIAGINLRDDNREFQLDGLIEQVAGQLERAKNDAINGVFTNSNQTPLSHGLLIYEDVSYLLFTDYDNYMWSGAEATESFSMPTDFVMSPNKGIPLHLSFEQFTGDFYVNGLPSDGVVTISLSDVQSGDSESISLNQVGLIIEIPFCGDGIIQAGEACDTGNNESNDNETPVACDAQCNIEFCGDNIIQENNTIRHPDGTEKGFGGGPVYEECDPEEPGGIGTCNNVCRIQKGGGGCSVAPYNESSKDSYTSQFLLLLVLAPLIVLGISQSMRRRLELQIEQKQRR